MTTPRTYGDGCGVAHGLDLVGERWALLVVRELLLGPKRFTDLRAGMPNASPNVLADRLRELERAGIVRRRRLAPPAGSRVYDLTDWGRELEGPILALGSWAVRSPDFPTDAPSGIDSLILALRTFADPSAAEGRSARYALRLDEQDFRVEVTEGRIQIDRGGIEEPDAIITADPHTATEVFLRDRPLAEAERSGDLRVEGDRQAVKRLLRLFPRPEPAAHADTASATS